MDTDVNLAKLITKLEQPWPTASSVVRICETWPQNPDQDRRRAG